MKDSTKAKIDSMTIEELEWESENESKSIFRTTEKRKYLANRLSQLKAEESLQRHRENIEVQNSAKVPYEKHYWYQKPLGIIFCSVFAILIGACLIYLIGKHFGVIL